MNDNGEAPFTRADRVRVPRTTQQATRTTIAKPFAGQPGAGAPRYTDKATLVASRAYKVALRGSRTCSAFQCCPAIRLCAELATGSAAPPTMRVSAPRIHDDNDAAVSPV